MLLDYLPLQVRSVTKTGGGALGLSGGAASTVRPEVSVSPTGGPTVVDYRRLVKTGGGRLDLFAGVAAFVLIDTAAVLRCQERDIADLVLVGAL